MRCVQCNHLMKQRATSAYAYQASGLPNLTLHDIDTYRCPSCGDELVSFQSIAPLHRAVAIALATKATRLTPFEVRYLRDHLGWSNQEFAARMDVTQSHASRWTTTQQIGGAAERLLRIFVLLGAEGSASTRDLRDMLKSFASETPSGASKLDAHLRGKTWLVTVRDQPSA